MKRFGPFCLLKLTSAPWSLLLLAASIASVVTNAQVPEIQNSAGVKMQVDVQDRDPALSVTVPDGPPNGRVFKILLPEHVTILVHGQSDVQHLYIFDHNRASTPPKWRKIGNTLEYATDFGQIHFVAKATLVDDGILFHYGFVNHSTVDYDMVTAVTDPRFHAVFYDPRLERTYVHYKSGFALIAAHTPERLTMPLNKWFPVRYLASYSAPIPSDLVQTRRDGITYIYSPDRVDEPMIATLSEDGAWVAASFARDPGNVWTNPELTCQHADPQVPLAHDSQAQIERKILIFKGTLQDALEKVSTQVKELE